MADVIVKLKIMPVSIEVDLDRLTKDCREKIQAFGGIFHKAEKVPIAFGLSALEVIFLVDEQEGSDLEKLEENLKQISEISTVDVIDVRRALG